VAQERTYTRPGRPLDLILKKAIAIVMLSASYWLLDWLFGDRWGTFGPRIAQTVIGAAFAGGMLFGSWFLISSRHGLQEWAHTRQPNKPDTDLADEAFEEGPAEAIQDAVWTAIWRVVLRWRFGWLVLALVPATFAAPILIGVSNIWTSGSPLRMAAAPAGWGAYEYATSVFEHAAYYIFWGGLLIATITDMVTTLPSKKSGIGDTLAVAAFSAASLGIYIAFEGIWP